MAFMRHNNNSGRRHNNNPNQNRNRHNNNYGNSGGQSQGQRRPGSRINQVFESNGPDGRVRGTAQQIVEKYAGMARDAQVSGDKVLMLNYFQHAEHYQRLLNEINEENAGFEREREQQRQQHQPVVDSVESADIEDNSEADPDVRQQQPRQQQHDRNRQPQRSDRNPEQRQQQQNTERQDRNRNQDDDAGDDDNALPSFLHVPITAGIPAAPVRSSARPPLAARSEKPASQPPIKEPPKKDGENAPVKEPPASDPTAAERKPRAPRRTKAQIEADKAKAADE